MCNISFPTIFSPLHFSHRTMIQNDLPVSEEETFGDEGVWLGTDRPRLPLFQWLKASLVVKQEKMEACLVHFLLFPTFTRQLQ